MSFFVNYQRILKRIEEKAKAKTKKHTLGDHDDVYLLDGGSMKVYTQETFYLESMKPNNRFWN